ncbi:MAG TPA: hypothetical protein VND99_05815 [Candidatus Acidoferrales bacterium]|nr:hypothetical protein [Candidatus Acidoferrales bacterium]
MAKKRFPKWATKVTPLSKFLAMALFIIFPFVGFYLGIKYEQKIGLQNILIDKHAIQEPQIITATDKNTNQLFKAHVGNIIKIVLHSTYWNFEPVDSSILKQVSDPVIAPDKHVRFPGSGLGTISIEYKVVGIGKTDINASRNSCGEAMRCIPGRGNFVLHIIAE